jgi:hypothetical protein
MFAICEKLDAPKFDNLSFPRLFEVFDKKGLKFKQSKWFTLTLCSQHKK